MSKELTEKWENGTLKCGFYYLQMKDGIIRTDDTVYIVGEKMYRWRYSDICYVQEVLEHVPSFHDLCELKQELEICKEGKAYLYAKLCNALMQLEEANKLISVIGCQTKNEDLEKCIEYCKKWGVK